MSFIPEKFNTSGADGAYFATAKEILPKRYQSPEIMRGQLDALARRVRTCEGATRCSWRAPSPNLGRRLALHERRDNFELSVGAN